MEENTRVGEMKAKEKIAIQWHEPPKKKPGEELMKNMAVASALVLCAIALKGGALPSMTDAADAVIASVSDDTLLDDQLGKLSFVSKLFPEATLVFGQSQPGQLSLPVSGGVVVHAWSEAEPYLSWRTSTSQVCSASGGTVMGVYHGADEERLVQVMNEQGVTCVYGNLREALVETGDSVQAGDQIGELMPGKDCLFELRVDGRSVDPSAWWPSAT